MQQLSDWMWTYSKVTIILNSENDRLLSWTEDMDIASKRYENIGIVVCEHPQHVIV